VTRDYAAVALGRTHGSARAAFGARLTTHACACAQETVCQRTRKSRRRVVCREVIRSACLGGAPADAARTHSVTDQSAKKERRAVDRRLADARHAIHVKHRRPHAPLTLLPTARYCPHGLTKHGRFTRARSVLRKRVAQRRTQKVLLCAALNSGVRFRRIALVALCEFCVFVRAYRRRVSVCVARAPAAPACRSHAASASAQKWLAARS
jgi:hypothetical protein